MLSELFVQDSLEVFLIVFVRQNLEEKLFIGLVGLVHGVSSGGSQLEAFDGESLGSKQAFLGIFVTYKLNV